MPYEKPGATRAFLWDNDSNYLIYPSLNVDC
jgi:hypothetical protein